MPGYYYNEGLLVAKEGQSNTLATPYTVAQLQGMLDASPTYQAGDIEPVMGVPVDTQDAIEAYNKQETTDMERLGALFNRYEIPIGFLSKALMLSEYHLHFIIDDSGSMNEPSDVNRADAHPQFTSDDTQSPRLTRWEEVQDRLHRIIELLQYIPSQGITVSFLNKSQGFSFKHAELASAENAHDTIRGLFKKPPAGGTPIYTKLTQAFKTKERTMVYLLTDGAPTDATEEDVVRLIKMRDKPKDKPLTLLSCTNEAPDWLEVADREAEYVSSVDDFETEKVQVKKKQGPMLPYSKGIWLLCNLLSAICPFDLDALDEDFPLCKYGVENYLGRNITKEEYHAYLNTHPSNPKITPAIRGMLEQKNLTPQAVSELFTKQDKERVAVPLSQRNTIFTPSTSHQSRANHLPMSVSKLYQDYLQSPCFDSLASADKGQIYVHGSKLVMNMKQCALPPMLKMKIWQQIESLHREIHSFWPYPNKDLKALKMHALCELVEEMECTNNLSQSLDKIKSKYQPLGLLSGALSTRTHDLFLELEANVQNAPAQQSRCFFR